MLFYSVKKFVAPIVVVVVLLALLRGMTGGWGGLFDWSRDANQKGEEVTTGVVDWGKDKVKEVAPKDNPIEAWIDDLDGQGQENGKQKKNSNKN